MSSDQIVAYCLAKPGAYEDTPYGPTPICLKIRGRVFAQVHPDPFEFRVTMRAEPLVAEEYRMQYPQAVNRSKYTEPGKQTQWMTVEITDEVPEDVVRRMLDQAYDMVAQNLPKSRRSDLLED